ncbi:unnamed protein product [Hermetia illucens]|uniref:Uncharacterized protein n=1 Tax=Hermetia illucens TaxID=343691 RepID=A0A7R8US34_HERIL|nr:unnamed protein product [Hermetia illucens]
MSTNIELAISFHLGKVQELKVIRAEVENLERNALGFVCHLEEGKYMDLITGDDVLKCLERLNNKIRMNEERILHLNTYKLEANLSAMCSSENDSFPEESDGNISYALVPATNVPGEVAMRSSYFNRSQNRQLRVFPANGTYYIPVRRTGPFSARPDRLRRNYYENKKGGARFVSQSVSNLRKIEFS